MPGAQLQQTRCGQCNLNLIRGDRLCRQYICITCTMVQMLLCPHTLQGHATVSLRPAATSKGALAEKEETIQELRETNEVGLPA